MTKKQSKATQQANAQRAAERAAAIRKEQEAKERRRRTIVVTVAVLAVLTALLAIFTVVNSNKDTTGQVATPPAGVVDTYALPMGPNDAPVTVKVYEDFMCPFCGQFEAASRQVLQQYAADGKVQVQYHVMSFLDRASNGTEYSTRAMNALGVVLDTSGPEIAKKFHDLLYENQPQENTNGLSDDDLIALAVKAGATKSDVAGPIRDRRFEQWVVNASEAASKAGVNSTPTVFVDGKQIEAGTIDEMVTKMQAAIDAAAGQ